MMKLNYSALMMGLLAFYTTACDPTAAQLADAQATTSSANSSITVPSTSVRVDIVDPLEIDVASLAEVGVISGLPVMISSYTIQDSKGKTVAGVIDEVKDAGGNTKYLSVQFATVGIYKLTLQLMNSGGEKASVSYRIFQSTVAAPPAKKWNVVLDPKTFIAYLDMVDAAKNGFITSKAQGFNEGSLILLNKDGKTIKADATGAVDFNKDGIKDFAVRCTGGCTSGSIEVIEGDKSKKLVEFNFVAK